MLLNSLAFLYKIVLVLIALYGFNALVMSILFWRYRRHLRPNPASAPAPAEWPTVTVQLPMFNEKMVVERLIDAVAALDYPAERLHIQVLDDSTDETAVLARNRVAFHRARGVNIEHVRRPNRTGYKAGALAYGLSQSTSEFVAIFDADFVPPRGFLKQVIPHFAADARRGMIQARWGHINAKNSALTRAQAIALDGHFVIEQTVRSRAGLLMNFNGSGGVWRRACIDEAGGWQAETIAEDLDLSYRAQLAGWRMHYLPDVVAPAEIPPLLTAFKRQQFRWAKGSVQCLRKFAGPVLRAEFSAWQKVQSLLHLSGYLIHALILVMILLGLPVILTQNPGSLSLGALGLIGFAPPVLFALSQWAIYPDWGKRFAYFPVLVMLGAGITINNSRAIFEAITGKNGHEFLRTPKFRAEGHTRRTGVLPAEYRVPVDWTTLAELLVGAYCLLEALVAYQFAPGLMPFLAVYSVGYFYTAGLGLWQSWAKIQPFARRFQQRATAKSM